MHICNICKIEFKYLSLLTRHSNKKKLCTISNTISNNISNNFSNTINNTNNTNNTINTNNTTSNIKLQHLDLEDIVKLFTNIINEKIISIQNTNNNNTNNNNNNIIDIQNNKIIKCKNCNKIFSSNSSLCNHKKLNRCKVKPISQQNKLTPITPIITPTIPEIITNTTTPIIPTTSNTLNNILNLNLTDSQINNTTNNIINNHITINAFGCESLEHITINQFKSLFNNFNELHKILYKLSSLVYIKNSSNMNFTKQNMNKNVVSYLDTDMEVKHISERDFIKEFEDNIKKLCIELFHIHKNDIKINDLIEYMKSFLMVYDNIQGTKTTHKELKEQLQSVMDFVFRNKDVNEIIKNITNDLQNNEILKEQLLNNNKNRIKDKQSRLNEFYYIPDIPHNKKNKNLNNIKTQATTENLQHIHQFQIDNDNENNID